MIVLGIDQASRSGWGICRQRQVVRSGLAKSHVERKAVVELALVLAGGDPGQLLVVFEDHSGMQLTRLTRDDKTTQRRGRQGAPERNTAVILGMGAAKGRWEALLDDVGHPKALRDKLMPQVWRSKLGIRGRGTDELKAKAAEWASQHMGGAIVDLDEAEGICLAFVGGMDGLDRLDARKSEARAGARGKREAKKQLSLGVS